MYIIIGKENCIFCNKAKKLLNKHKLKYKYYDYKDQNSYKYNHLIPNDYMFVPKIVKLNEPININNIKGKFYKNGYIQLEEQLEEQKTIKTIKSKSGVNKQNKIKTKTKTKRLGHCAPGSEISSYTCFNKESLISIIKSWNEKNKDKIKYNHSDSKKILWNKINKKFIKKCDNEKCWLKKGLIKKSLVKEHFKPLKPKEWDKNPREWLSTVEIENVLKQYEKIYPDFLFMGCVPIDFDYELSPGNCVINELCKIKINKYLKHNKKYIGIVFNLDKHHQDGSHWVSMFCNFKKNEICYFDSYGYDVPSEIKRLMKRLKNQHKKYNNLDLKLKYNNVRHQYKNSECGVYCINFIVNMLNNVSFETFINKKIPDDLIFKKRNYFFI